MIVARASLGSVINTLCVNFLLYVVLIIVFYMLVRFYFEEETTSNASERSVEYGTKRVTEKYSIEESNEDVEEEGAGIGDTGKLINTKTADRIDMDRNVEEEMQISAVKSSLEMENKKESLSELKSFLNVSHWGEPDGTKEEVIQRCIFCAMGLHVTFGIWGLLQERMLTRTYDGEYFVDSYGLVFMNRLGGLVLSTFLMYYFKVEWVKSPLWEYSFPSVANMLSSWCQYEALKYVSFPTQMLAKAFKIVPVMLMGKFLHSKSYEGYEYISAATIGVGAYLFISSSENLDLGQNVFGDVDGITGTWCGVVLLIFYLFFDSFTGQWQTRMFEIYKDMSSLQMMLIMNAFSTVFSFVTLVHQEELSRPFEFVYRHPEFALHTLGFTVSSTVGQLFIFYTVQKFGAVVFSIIMAIRILLSVFLSCIVYGHQVTELGYLGMVLVFGATAYRIRRKSEGSPLIRWRETEDAKEIFKEWHEHLDI